MFLRSINFPFAGMYQAMGISFSSAVIPVVLALVWVKTNKNGVFWAILVGAFSGILYWSSVGFDMSWGVVWSNIIVMLVSLVVVVGWSLIKPENFDYSLMEELSLNKSTKIK
jgi:Na+/proline symporter